MLIFRFFWVARFLITFCLFFFFNDTATTEIYTLSLHDALPISVCHRRCCTDRPAATGAANGDRKSTRLNSSHGYISYAVFCLKKKKKNLKSKIKKKKKNKNSKIKKKKITI